MITPTVWTWSTYADVHAALRDDRLAPHSVHTRGDDTHTVVREAVAQELPPELLTGWRVALSAAAVRLAADLHAHGGADTVQSFVALTQTVPALVSSVLLAAAACAQSHASCSGCCSTDERTLATGSNALLRYAGPSRAEFRTALAPVVFGDIAVDTGDEVVLLLAEANRNAARFTNPDVLDVSAPRPAIRRSAPARLAARGLRSCACSCANRLPRSRGHHVCSR